jgi:hypothetical protein
MLLEFLGVVFITVDLAVVGRARRKSLHPTKSEPPRPIAEEGRDGPRSREPTERKG